MGFSVASHKAMVYEFLKVATLSWEPTYKSHLYTRIATLYDDKTSRALGHFIHFQMNKWIKMCKVSSKNVKVGAHSQNAGPDSVTASSYAPYFQPYIMRV
jgi:hypothetical protein